MGRAEVCIAGTCEPLSGSGNTFDNICGVSETFAFNNRALGPRSIRVSPSSSREVGGPRTPVIWIERKLLLANINV